jgi:RNA polymerase sigma factor (sigma-70 family)
MEWDGFHALVQRARSGDCAACDEMLARVMPQLRKQVAQVVGPEWQNNSFDDLVQKACLREFQKIQTFEGGSNDEETYWAYLSWSAELVQNVIRNHWRDKGQPIRRPPGRVASLDPHAGADSSNGLGPAVCAQDPTASKHLRDEDRDTRIAEALSALEPIDREIIRLHYFEDLSYREIAERLGLTFEKVRYRHDKLLEQLDGPLSSLMD